MRLTRFVAGAIAASLMGLVPVALTAAPANAVDYDTVTTLSSSYKVIEFKGYQRPYLQASVKTTTGESVNVRGTFDLYAKVGGTSTWKKISSYQGYSTGYFSDVVPKKNTQYYVAYTGGATYNGVDTYRNSTSNTVTVKVQRKLTIKSKSGRRVKVTGKVAPKYKKKKVHVHKKVGKKWKKVRTVRTNKKSRFKMTMPPAGRKPTKYRFTVPGNKKFAKTTFIGTLRRI